MAEIVAELGGLGQALAILAAVLPLALLAVYGTACVLALRPRRGTLEWISWYRRRAAPLPGRAAALVRSDAAVMAAVFLLTAVIRCLTMAAFLPGHGLLLAALLLENIAAPAVGAALVYAICKRLFGCTGPAFFAAALVAMDLSLYPSALVFSAAGLFFLARFLTAPEDASFGDMLPALAGCFGFLGAGCFFDAALLCPAAAALIAAAADCVSRRARAGGFRLLPALPSALITMAAAAVLVHIPAGIAEGMRFPRFLLSQTYYELIANRLLGAFSPHLWLPALLQLQYDWFLILAGLTAAAAELVSWVRRRDWLCALLVLWTLSQAAALLLSGSHALSLSCALCLCHIWSRLQKHGRSWLVAVGAGVLLLLFLGQGIILLILESV